MTLSFPIEPKLAAKAYRIQKNGLKGKDTAEKLGKGLTTTEPIYWRALGVPMLPIAMRASLKTSARFS